MEVHQLRLIEEVRKRPKLWAKKRKKNVQKIWTEVGSILDTDASMCKRTWQIMRIRFWVETKRVLKRIEKDKDKGIYNSAKKYTNWPLFDTLRFLENVQSGHRKYHTLGDMSDVEITKIKTARYKPYTKRKSIESKSLAPENSKAAQPTAINVLDDKEQQLKKTLNTPASENATISNENTTHHSNTYFKKEPELQIEADCFESTDFVKVSIKEENPENISIDASHDVSEQQIKSFLNPPANECATISYENTAHRNNTYFKKEPEPQVAADCLSGANFVRTFIKEEHPEESALSEDQYARSPTITDENYSFLYSFVSQTKLMSQSQKMEFRIKMKNLLLYIFPASSSVDILENQLLLAVDDDPDKKFLISFWPFMKSMSLTQNLEFRAKTADLVLNTLSTKQKRNFI